MATKESNTGPLGSGEESEQVMEETIESINKRYGTNYDGTEESFVVSEEIEDEKTRHTLYYLTTGGQYFVRTFQELPKGKRHTLKMDYLLF